MAGLFLCWTLPTNEKVIINGAVLENAGDATTLIVHNRVDILRRKEVMSEADAISPARRVYYALQCAYLFEQFQVATGRKHDQLRDYGPQAARIIDLSHEIDARVAYQRSIDLTELTANAYDGALERIADILQDLLNAADPISADDTNWADDNQVLADNLLLDFQTNLNIEIGGRYIFGGTNFTDAPVADLRGLTTYNTTDLASNGAAANTIETSNQIPEFTVNAGGGGTLQSYLTQHTGTTTFDAKSWEEVQVTISSDQTIEYGITATNEAFQNAVEAFMRFKSATQAGLTSDERNEFLSEARTLADSTKSQVRQLQASNGIFLTSLQNARETHDSFITISEIALDKITVADTATAATEMSALQTMMQASYTLIASRSQLTLVNYL